MMKINRGSLDANNAKYTIFPSKTTETLKWGQDQENSCRQA